MCEEVCAEALKKYGEALWRVNMRGVRQKGWKAWLGGMFGVTGTSSSNGA